MTIARLKRAILVTVAATFFTAACGCEDAEEFRAVAGGSLHSGLTTITTGLLDGLFAVFDPDEAA